MVCMFTTITTLERGVHVYNYSLGKGLVCCMYVYRVCLLSNVNNCSAFQTRVISFKKKIIRIIGLCSGKEFCFVLVSTGTTGCFWQVHLWSADQWKGRWLLLQRVGNAVGSHMCVRVHVHMCLWVYVCLHACMLIYVGECLHVCVLCLRCVLLCYA